MNHDVDFTLLEYVGGGSDKFYAAYYDGTHTWTHWGRNGAPTGQAQVQADPTGSFYRSKLNSKTAKGYGLVQQGTRTDVPALVREIAKGQRPTTSGQAKVVSSIETSLETADMLIQGLVTEKLSTKHGERFAELSTAKDRLAVLLQDLETRLEVASALMGRSA